jgi:transcriptional regulator with XRE-family HTH domain
MRKTAQQIDLVLGKRIMMLRQVVGFSLDELSRRCSLTFQELSSYENGVERVPASVLYIMARELDVDVEYFFEGPDYEPRPRPRLAVVARRSTE